MCNFRDIDHTLESMNEFHRLQGLQRNKNMIHTQEKEVANGSCHYRIITQCWTEHTFQGNYYKFQELWETIYKN